MTDIDRRRGITFATLVALIALTISGIGIVSPDVLTINYWGQSEWLSARAGH